MRTHVDTAAAVRLIDTDLFVQRTEGLPSVTFGPMSSRTLFFEEDDDRVLTDILYAAEEQGRPAEVVRVSRVIEVVV